MTKAIKYSSFEIHLRKLEEIKWEL